MIRRACSSGGRRGVVRVILGAALLAAVVACSSSPSPAAPTAPAPAGSASLAPTSTPSFADRGAPALAAYRGMWQDFTKAERTSDWQSGDLAHHAIGVALTNLSRALYADHRNGIITKGQTAFNPHVQSVQPVTGDAVKVVVRDCADTAKALKYYVSSGKEVGGGGGQRRITGVVEKQADGSWKVSDFAVEDLGTC